jgi:alkylresorcinol/alkylpyrone synthase
VKALKLARSLGDGVDNVLIVAVELPTTLADLTGTTRAVWQGNCTFGDGAAALWLSTDPARGPAALALETIHARQRSDAGLGLIRWGYRRYYGFAVADEPAFDRAVRGFVTEALSAIGTPWKGERAWAIHPAGIALLMRLARQLGIPPGAVEPSVRHYREHSNMSSVSVLHVLKDVASACPPGSAVNLLTMGAGFDVLYGRLTRVR